MFSAFQAALKDVFTVTVQKEEELSCPIVATALGKFAHLIFYFEKLMNSFYTK